MGFLRDKNIMYGTLFINYAVVREQFFIQLGRGYSVDYPVFQCDFFLQSENPEQQYGIDDEQKG